MLADTDESWWWASLAIEVVWDRPGLVPFGVTRPEEVRFGGAIGESLGGTHSTIGVRTRQAVRVQRVLVIDENYGPANVCGLLGMRPRYELKDVMQRGCALEDALVEGPAGYDQGLRRWWFDRLTTNGMGAPTTSESAVPLVQSRAG